MAPCAAAASSDFGVTSSDFDVVGFGVLRRFDPLRGRFDEDFFGSTLPRFDGIGLVIDGGKLCTAKITRNP